MRDLLLLALILSLGATGCNSFEGLTGKKSSGSAAAVTAPAGESGDAKAGDDNDKKDGKSCPVKMEGEDDSDDSGETEAEKKAAKEKEKSGGYEEMGLTDDGTEYELDECVSHEGHDS